jgi:hypothetical protein
MSRTPTLPPTAKTMWRKLIARAHPDLGGDHELFIWSRAAMEAICSGLQTDRPRPKPAPPRERSRASTGQSTDPERIPYRGGVFFNEITRHALAEAEEQPATYARLLRLLRDCHAEPGKQRQQQRGASYKQLAFAAHLAGMDKPCWAGWNTLCERIGLSDAHISHIISRLKRSGS